MMNSGAMHLRRLLTCVLTVLMLMTTCFTPAYAAALTEGFTLNLHWVDAGGMPHTVAATPLADSEAPAYWANLDAAALNQTLLVEAICSDPAYSFHMLDDWGNPTMAFVWLPEKDALYADAAYAYQLYYSVNGMQADQPLTLYVSSMPMPVSDTFQPYPVQVPVNYVTEDGTVLDSQYVECWAGETTPVWASSRNTADYALLGADRVDVVVDESGTANPAEVTFLYRRLMTSAPTETPEAVPVAQVAVPVVYYHENGEQLDFQEVFLTPGTHVIEAGSSKTAGYQLQGDASVRITVYEDGTTDQGSVVFIYTDVKAVEAVIPVYYKREDGTVLDIQDIVLSEGTHIVTPASAAVAELELQSASEVAVTVYADGSASMASVVFTYAQRQPAQAKVNVHYHHIDLGILDSQTILLTEGVRSVSANSSKMAGYIPVGSTEVEVIVNPDGTTDPATVDFYYEDAYTAPVNAELAIQYLLEDMTLYASDTKLLTPGTHTITPRTDIVTGMTVLGESLYVVNVDGNGDISPDTVSFVLRRAAATINVHYQDDRGRAVAPSQSYAYYDGTHIITASPENLPADYELAPGLHTQVTVTVIDGQASQSDVYFYYQQKPKAITHASVTVLYFDSLGKEIAPAQTVDLEPGIHQLSADTKILPQGYELISEPSINVEVYENGTFYPQEVAFYYRKVQEEGKSASIIIYFCDDRGNEIASSQMRSLPEGKHIVKAEPTDLPDGYVIFKGTNGTAEVTVSNGVAKPGQLVFYYQKAQVQPTVYDLPVMYYDTEGKQIAQTQYVHVAPGAYAIMANPEGLAQGYELMGENVMTVVVRQDGSTEPEEIAFYYAAPQKTAAVTVYYLNEDGWQIAEPFTMELAAGYHTLQPDTARVPAGYDPGSADTVKVYVSRDGIAEPAQVSFSFGKMVVETPIPVGEYVYRYAKVTGEDVAFRSEPSASGGKRTRLYRLGKKDTVFVLQENYNYQNEVWATALYNGEKGYIVSKYLSVMTQQESDAYAAGSTPAPTMPVIVQRPAGTPTPIPTEVPTPTPTPIVELITPPAATATLEPLPNESTAALTAAPKPTPYAGYALTTRATALKTGIKASDRYIIQSLEANELVQVIDQVNDSATGEVWSIVATLSGQPGYVQNASLRYITEKEAQPYLQLWTERNKTPAPTQFITATPEPMQLVGYGIVLGEGVPFRQMESEYSRIIENLDDGTVVYVAGQTPGNGQYWHSVNYNNRWGYIRADLVRMMTIAEEEAYVESQRATPTPATSNIPFDVNGMSSYGYVSGSTVNWRESPSKDGRLIGELKRYALCLVLGSKYVNGATWYEVRYEGKTGYIHGDYFRQMTMTELDQFLGSDEYLQGRQNNASGNASMDDVGVTGIGGIVSAEDQWVNAYPDVYATFEPFKPIATVAPIVSQQTLEPLPYQTATPTASPSPTPLINPWPDVNYPDAKDGGDGSMLAWFVVTVLLLLVGGGIFAMVRHQQNKRRMAMRAAQRRAQAARVQQQRPYARNGAQGQPRTGMYPNQQTSVRRPMTPQGGNNASAGGGMPGTNQYPAYTGNPYRQAEQLQDALEDDADTMLQNPVRTGRRTAYRQAQENSGQSDYSFDG